MSRFIWIGIGLLAAATSLCVSVVNPVAAEELTAATYMELTLARMRLAKDSWENTGQPPAEDEQQNLMKQFGTSVTEYFAFMSAHRLEVEGYLAGHAEINAEIQALGQRIRELISQRESPQ